MAPGLTHTALSLLGNPGRSSWWVWAAGEGRPVWCQGLTHHRHQPEALRTKKVVQPDIRSLPLQPGQLLHFPQISYRAVHCRGCVWATRTSAHPWPEGISHGVSPWTPCRHPRAKLVVPALTPPPALPPALQPPRPRLHHGPQAPPWPPHLQMLRCPGALVFIWTHIPSQTRIQVAAPHKDILDL